MKQAKNQRPNTNLTHQNKSIFLRCLLGSSSSSELPAGQRQRCVRVSRPTLCNPMGCSPPGSFVPGVFQTRILERTAIPSPGDLPDPGITPASPSLALQADSSPLSLRGSPPYSPRAPATGAAVSRHLDHTLWTSPLPVITSPAVADSLRRRATS